MSEDKSKKIKSIAAVCVQETHYPRYTGQSMTMPLLSEINDGPIEGKNKKEEWMQERILVM